VPLTSFDLSLRFFLELAVILVVCQLVRAAFHRIGQSAAVGEMVAGVLMGPSLLGLLVPDVEAYLFPTQAMPILFAVAQVGLVLYMFLVGVEFDVGLMQKRVRSAAAVSAAGILVPFALGAAIALAALGGTLPFFTAGVTPLQAILYFGAAMSITAFPMLARIVEEQGITKTALGTLVLAAGSLDDTAAWCLLAIALASLGSGARYAVLAIGGGVVFALLVLGPLRRALAPLGERVRAEGMSAGLFARVLVLVMAAAWLTDAIRIYAVFGAFLTGVAMPRGRFADELKARIGPLTTGFLVPLFFVLSGLNTRIGLLSTPALLLAGLGILAAACLGKFGACWAAARLAGLDARDSLAVGALMNARGLMELIILNIGLERGIIQPALFTIMVLMAIVTTLMATPLFVTVYRRAETPRDALVAARVD
jgi:K+:H+ antiporter